MSQQTDPDFLQEAAYDGAASLNTRIAIQERLGTDSYGWFHWLYDRLNLPEDGRLLDLGAGPGTLWQENRHRLPAGVELVLSDLSPGMLGDTRELLSGLPQVSLLVAADAQAIPFAAGSFAVVLANGLFDHVPHRRQSFAEIGRILHENGRLYASAGSRRHLRELELLVKPFAPAAEYGGEPERFGLENGEALLSPYFESVCCHTYCDTLIFREVEPILSYILSEEAMHQELATRTADLRDWLHGQLAESGEIHVSLEKCLFEAAGPH